MKTKPFVTVLIFFGALFCLLFSSVAFAKEDIDNFLGIKWGTPILQAEEEMIKNGYPMLERKETDLSMKITFGGEFDGHEANFFLFCEKEDHKFVQANIILRNSENNEIYNELLEKFNAKYSTPATGVNLPKWAISGTTWTDSFGVTQLITQQDNKIILIRYFQEKRFEFMRQFEK